MPKAENRKRPPNLMGPAPGRGSHGKSDNVARNTVQENAKNKKQEILERMKAIQREKGQK